jgi:predicted nuclease of predicted toxin-antitoxin system
MRFLCDMGIGWRVVEWLRQQGHDATHLRDERLQRLPNGDIFTKARKESRAIITCDQDFGEIVASSGGEPSTVIVLRLRNMRPDHVIERLAAVPSESEDAILAGAVIAVEEHRYRVRSLPLP